jgi:hypothetical protein
MDPCAGNPRFDDDGAEGRRLLVVVEAPALAALRAAGTAFEIVRDLSELADPLTYVSKTNRYAAELARLRAAKSGR